MYKLKIMGINKESSGTLQESGMMEGWSDVDTEKEAIRKIRGQPVKSNVGYAVPSGKTVNENLVVNGIKSSIYVDQEDRGRELAGVRFLLRGE